jgi:diguanylate cyclase (GGDEF)-like protein/putative nucleotidyltransferase with HDIG domain
VLASRAYHTGEFMNDLSVKARFFVGATLVIGLCALVSGLFQWHIDNPTRFVCYLILVTVAAALKVRLPGVTGTMSVVFLFLLIGILELSLAETLLMSCAGALVQCWWHAAKRPKLVQVLFNVANLTTATAISYYAYHSRLASALGNSAPLLLAALATTFFIVNTIPVAIVISLTERKPAEKIWSECYFWSFPYYLVGAAIAGLISTMDHRIDWQMSLLVLPVIYFIYRTYHLYLGRLEGQKGHAEEIAALHLRTIEALALAIDAKDHTTHDHLRRVQTYAVEIGRELGLNEGEIEALQAAALLHDIGKLAVPEHIISKPGRLTPEEFEKMKIHPIVGAEILEKVRFPYAVVPIVRAHHERWDGTGYPDGLKGDEIPIGARILSAIDCLDAIASDRPYRRALPLEKAIEVVVSEAGKGFDPQVVDVLRRRCRELEQSAHDLTVERAQLSTHVRIAKGAAPATGLDDNTISAQDDQEGSIDFLGTIGAARQEVQTLFELSRELGNSLSLEETLSVLAARLKKLIPHDAIAVYFRKDGHLTPEYVSGENFRALSSLRIPLGEGVSGWVAANARPILNGRAMIESSYLKEPTKLGTLRAVLAVPLVGTNGIVGVLSLYGFDQNAFSKDHLRILLAISSKLALSIENALKYRQAESSATTDYLTGLPNARSLFLHLDRELARCKRSKNALAVVVCDLDGFKEINDHFGHLEGNRVLHALAEKLKASCREYDYVSRMGGDEFVLVLPGVPPATVGEKEELIRRLTAEVGWEICARGGLSMSVGHAFYPSDGTDAEELLAEADRRMYLNKRKGSDHLVAEPKLKTMELRLTRLL